MQHWTICILVLAWRMVIVGAQCPSGFNCSGTTSCYLTYPGRSGLKYQDPNGDIWIFDDDRVIYLFPKCHKYMPMKAARQSCTDTQRECEKQGGSIAVINSEREYDALTGVVHSMMLDKFNTKFNVFYQAGILLQGCSTLTIENYSSTFKVIREYIGCFTTSQIDAIICEASDVNITKICPKPKIPKPTNEVPPIKSTASVKTAAILGSVILTILLICFFGCVRYKRRTTQYGNGTHVIRYQVAGENVHGTVLHRPTTAAISQNYDPISTNETVYRDVEVKYDDIAAAKEVEWCEKSTPL